MTEIFPKAIRPT